MNRLHFKIKSGWHLCCLFCILYFFSCQKEKSNKSEVNTIVPKTTLIAADSLSISITFKGKGQTDLNIPNSYLHMDELVFVNPKEKDTIITKKIKKIYEYQVIDFLGYSIINGVSRRHKHHYLIRKDTDSLSFIFYQGNILLESSKYGIVVDSVFEKYNKINVLARSVRANEKLKITNVLDSLRNDFQEKYLTQNDTILKQLNDQLYYNALQQLTSDEEAVSGFLEKESKSIATSTLRNLLFYYVKNNIDKLNFESLLETNNSNTYTNLLAIGVFNFLRHEENIGKPQYKKAIDWLKSTSLYKENELYVNKEISPLDNAKFKEMLGNLTVYDTNFHKITLQKVFSKNITDYYLIDLWATWCKPCIEGIKNMKEMELPENVSVVSLSIDKNELKEKWKKMTKELNQEITYLIEENISENIDFLNLIDLKSIPRYILIDYQMNLLDEAFYHPNELQFLPKLRDIKYAKYW